MRRVIGPFGVALALLILASGAKAQDFIVDARRLDKVENPSDLQRWAPLINSPVGRALAKVVLSSIGVPQNSVDIAVTAVNIIVSEPKGTTYTGAIQAPQGYTVCRAQVHQYDENKPDHIGGYGPSLNCGNTFNASYRTADDPASAKIDGLHWYMVVNRPGPFQGRCWVDGVVTVAFVKAEKKPNYNCVHSGEIAWTYKGG